LAATIQAAPIDNIKLRFKISARDLPDKDTLGTIDPYVEIFYTDDGQKEKVKLGRTGTITDQENPDWGDVFEFDFNRAKHQRWHFEVFDHDNGREDDKAGQAYVDVADFVDKNQHLNANLNKKGYLTLTTVDPLPPSVAPPAPVQFQQVQTVPVVQHVQTVPLVPTTGGVLLVPQTHIITVPDKMKLRFKLSARDLPEKDKLGTIDPYVELYFTEGASTKEKKFAKSATIDNTKNPQWGEVFEFDYDRSKQQKWLFKIYDHDQGREDDSAGKVWVDVSDYIQKSQITTVNLSKKGTLTIQSDPPIHRGTIPPQQISQPQVVQPVAPPAPAPVAQKTSPPIVQQVGTPLARIQFRLSAKGLEDKDILGTSDPHVKIYSKIGSEPELQIGSTAKLEDTENPVWPDTFTFEFDPTKNPKLRFLVLDEDDGRRDDELGEAWLDVNEYVKNNQDQTLSLKKGTINVSKY